MKRLRTFAPGPRRVALGLISFVSACALVACSGGSTDSAAGGGGRGGGRAGRGGGAGGAQPVVVARAQQKDVPIDIAAVGNVEAYNTIAVRSQVTGTIEEVAIHEGDFVKKGALLFRIDERQAREITIGETAWRVDRHRAGSGGATSSRPGATCFSGISCRGASARC